MKNGAHDTILDFLLISTYYLHTTGVNIILPNSTKKSGRPRKFNTQQVMDAAVEVFWLRGFDGTSLDDLTLEMGINRPSLYGAFGDKKTLYMQALDHYSNGIGSIAMKGFLAEPDIHAAVEKMLSLSLKCQTRTGQLAKGCMLANCAPSTFESVPEARAFLLKVLTASQLCLVERFEFEIANGNLPSTFPKEERASMLLDFVQAQAYRARAGENKKQLLEAISHKVGTILSAT